MKIKSLAPLLLAIVLPASAAPQMCFDQAGKDYNIDPLLLMSISIQESRLIATATNSSNSDGTEDVCGMQINSSHYKKLAGFNITRERLMNDPCICVYTGAWVLAHNFKSYGKNWDSVGIYNTGPSKKLIGKCREYAEKIKSIYRILQARKILLDKQPTETTAGVLQTDSMSEIKTTQ